MNFQSLTEHIVYNLMKKALLAILALVLVEFICVAQTITYPVHTVLQMTPPFPANLDMTTIQEKMSCTLVLNDNEEMNYPVRLKFEITGQGITIRTKEDYNPFPIKLDYNIPNTLSGYDLVEYFNPNNLTFEGISQEQFMQSGGVLPEGVYTICVGAFDYTRFWEAGVSNPSCVVMSLEDMDPPRIISPIGIQESSVPQNLLFQWQPMHIGGVLVEYTIRVYETQPNLTADLIIANEAPVFEHSVLQTLAYVYGAGDPPLITGKDYIVTVQAQSLENTGVGSFKNNGVSAHEVFTYGEECGVPTLLNLTAKSEDEAIRVGWSGASIVNTVIWYRNADIPDANWYEDKPVGNPHTIQNLQPEYTYEVKVAAHCEGAKEPVLFSETQSIYLSKGEDEFWECGLPVEPEDLDMDNLLPMLYKDDVVEANDFKVVVTKATGSNGVFYGTGYVYVPYFNQARVNVKFLSGITVNTDYQLIQGNIQVTGAGLQLIGEELLGQLEDILEALDTVDQILAAVEEILVIVDLMIAQMEPYLPDDVMKDLKDAQAGLIAAQQALEDAQNADPLDPDAIAAAEQALQNAINTLNAAKDKYKQALEDFLKKLLSVIKASIQSLWSDLTNNGNDSETDFKNAEEDLNTWMNQNNSGITELGESEEVSPFIDVIYESSFEDMTTEEVEKLAQNPTYTAYETKVDNYYKADEEYALRLVIERLNSEVAAKQHVNELVNVFLKVQRDILAVIGPDIKAKKEVDEIVPVAKEFIKQSILKILTNIQ